MSPTTIERVPAQTAEAVNAAIQRRSEEEVAHAVHAGSAAIEARLAELDREWDIERTLETNAAAVALLGVALGATVSRKWFWLPGVVAAFLLQHAVQGWCPPLPIFRRLGFRTAAEIARERYALKALRGDFRDVSHAPADAEGIHQALAAAMPSPRRTPPQPLDTGRWPLPPEP